MAGDTTTLKCRGRIASDTAGELKRLVKPMIAKCRQIILDISDVSFVDGSGLGTLVGLKLSAGSVAYCNLEFVNSSPVGDGITAYDEAAPVPPRPLNRALIAHQG